MERIALYQQQENWISLIDWLNDDSSWKTEAVYLVVRNLSRQQKAELVFVEIKQQRWFNLLQKQIPPKTIPLQLATRSKYKAAYRTLVDK